MVMRLSHIPSPTAEHDEADHGDINPWEVVALDRNCSHSRHSRPLPQEDSIIFPGLYSASGFDILQIFMRVISRPEPKIDLGPVDCSVSFVVCDLIKTDTPVVYVSHGFTLLTGYTLEDSIGRNCRFLQSPPGLDPKADHRECLKDGNPVSRMRRAVDSNHEIQLEVDNYRKDGRRFLNHLSIIPLRWDSSEFRYSIGFMGYT